MKTVINIEKVEIEVNIFENNRTFDTDHEQREKLIQSTIAEVVACEHYGGELNDERLSDGDDGGFDFTDPFGNTVDVKSSEHPHLVIPGYQQLRADYYLFVRMDDENAEIVGFVSRKEARERQPGKWCDSCGTPAGSTVPGRIFHPDELHDSALLGFL